MPDVHEVNDCEQLQSYRLLWNSLLPKTRKATFFQSIDWLETYWRHWGSNQSLRVLIASAAGEPVGILPLVVRTESTRLGSARVLTYPLDNWGTFYGAIGPNPTATLQIGLQHIRRTRRDWDVLDLRWVDAAGLDFGRTRHAMEFAGFPSRKRAWTHTALVGIDDTWDAYWESRSRKWRHTVDRLRQRLARKGRITHVRHRPKPESAGDGDPRWDLYDACAKIARRSRKRSANPASASHHRRVRRFLRHAHSGAAKTGSLDLNLLQVDGRPAAFAYNYIYRGRPHVLAAGRDPSLAGCGAGIVLQQLMLKDGFRRRDRFYELGAGRLYGKRHWQTSTATSFRYTHFTAAPKAQLLRLQRWYRDRFGDEASLQSSRSA